MSLLNKTMTFRNGKTCIIALPVKVHFTLEQATKGHMGSTVSLTLVLDRCSWSMPCPTHFTPPLEATDTYSIEGWLGPRAGLGGYRESRTHQGSTPGPSSLQQVAIPTFTASTEYMYATTFEYFLSSIQLTSNISP